MRNDMGFRPTVFLGACLGIALLSALPLHGQTLPARHLDGAQAAFRVTPVSPDRPPAASLGDWQTRPVPERLAQLEGPDTSRLAKRPQQSRPRSRSYSQAQRLTAAVAMGVLGAIGGGLVGAGIGTGAGENGALAGFAIGMPIGAAAGATIGVLMVR